MALSVTTTFVCSEPEYTLTHDSDHRSISPLFFSKVLVCLSSYEQNTNYANKLDVSICEFFSITYIVIHPKNEKYLKKYLKYFPMYLYLNTFVLKRICI